MARDETKRLFKRSLSGCEAGFVRLVAAHEEADGAIVLHFGANLPARLDFETLSVVDLQSSLECLPGGGRIRIDVDRSREIAAGQVYDIAVDGVRATITPTPLDLELLADTCVLLGLRHAESAEVVRDWLAYHARTQGAETALILDCGAPDERDAFAEGIETHLESVPELSRVVLVTSGIPLGRAGLPPAAHSFNAPSAPGRARMKGIVPDPAQAPLGETIVFEALRQVFLDRARAVLCLDVSDLALPSPAGTVFERVLSLERGYLGLSGREAYPWRLPRDRDVAFGDHICVPFDGAGRRRRWAVVPACATEATWRMTRLSGIPMVEDDPGFIRYVALRHPGAPVAALVPKSSLVEMPTLVDLSRRAFGAAPARMPAARPRWTGPGPGHVTVVTCMKNEGPFILEWLAYHRSIGIDRFLVYSNDCTDGTDRMLDLLQARGLVVHRDNPYRRTGQKPQHAAFQAAETEPLVEEADWLICMDVDEFINVHAGEGRIEDLFAAVGDANMISMTWRLFGNSDIARFEDVPVTERFTRCAALTANKPHQAWGFKTLFRHQGLFRKLGVHRPKGLVPQLKDHIRWVNGSGQFMPETAYRTAWRSTTRTVGYDLVTLNHYAVRSAESFLVKRDRGRVNHVERDQGLLYWFRMNNNTESNHSIGRRRLAMETELARLKADPEIGAAHEAAVTAHRRRIEELKSREDYARFYDALISDRMRKLSRLHPQFGSGVFWSGPHVVPDDIVERDPDESFFFTVTPEGKGH